MSDKSEYRDETVVILFEIRVRCVNEMETKAGESIELDCVFPYTVGPLDQVDEIMSLFFYFTIEEKLGKEPFFKHGPSHSLGSLFSYSFLLGIPPFDSDRS